MGCHTRVYRRVGNYRDFIEDFNIEKLLQEEIEHSIDFYYFEMVESKLNQQSDALELRRRAIRYLKFLNRLKKLYKKGCLRNSEKFKEFIFDIAKPKMQFQDDLYICKKGIIYEEIPELRDQLFRISKYDVEAHSFEETLDIIDKYYDPEKPYRGGKLNTELVKKFWSKHPDGLIIFG